MALMCGDHAVAIAAALALRGNGALLNFPKLAHSLPRPADTTDKSIQAAATLAANNFATHRGGPDAEDESEMGTLGKSSSGGSRNPNGGKSSSTSSKRREAGAGSKRSGSSDGAGNSSNRYNVMDSSARDQVENLQHYYHVGSAGDVGHSHSHGYASASAQPMYIDSEDMFTIGPGGLTNLYDAMCIPPPDPEHTDKSDGEEGANNWEPHLWSY